MLLPQTAIQYRSFKTSLHYCTAPLFIDLIRAYYQIPVEPADIPKIAVTTPLGLFEFLCKPFDLRNAAQTFQRFIDQVLHSLHFCYAYINDLLIARRAHTGSTFNWYWNV